QPWFASTVLYSVPYLEWVPSTLQPNYKKGNRDQIYFPLSSSGIHHLLLTSVKDKNKPVHYLLIQMPGEKNIPLQPHLVDYESTVQAHRSSANQWGVVVPE